MEQKQLQNIIEAVLLSAEKPLKVPQIEALFAGDSDIPTRDEIRQALHELGEQFEDRGFELKQVASGFRIQVRQDFAPWVGRLWEEKPARYTRALLETLALIAYRQPITRGEIEEVRGVSVSSNIIKTLMERDWIHVLGHKDVPGKPALYGTTKFFLDYFNLKTLEELPTLAELKDLDNIHPELALGEELSEDAAASEEPEPANDSAAAAEAANDDVSENETEAASDEATEAESAEANPTDESPEDDVDMWDETAEDDKEKKPVTEARETGHEPEAVVEEEPELEAGTHTR